MTTAERTLKDGRTSPTRRLVLGMSGEQYVAELRNRVLVVRPKGSRRGGEAEVSVGWGQIYQRELILRAERKLAEKRRAAAARKAARR